MLEPIFSGIKKQVEVSSGEKTTRSDVPPVASKATTPTTKISRKTKKYGSLGMNTPSIKKALKGEFEEEQKLSSKEQHEVYSKAGEEEPFTEKQLIEKWNIFLKKVEDRPSIKSTLSVSPKIGEDYTLLLAIDNRIQDDLLAEVRPELVSFLRKELHNSKINLKTVVTEIIREKIIYSDAEKFQEMAAKNPSLDLLRKKFSLDF